MSSYAATVAAYACIVALALVAELVTLVTLRPWAGLGQVFTWALRRRSTQVGLLLAWWWLGWHWVTER